MNIKPHDIRNHVLKMVKEERSRQEKKHNDQFNDDGMFYKIFFEEFGEFSQALLENDTGSAIVELNQAISVLVAWQEQIYMRYTEDVSE